MPLETGFILHGRYRIERVLGHGGMGAVYLAIDESLGIQCAVKENLNLSPDSERQFRREATLLASLRHPNMPRVTNHFILGGQQYLVMDFVEGEDLKERLMKQHPLPEADVLGWMLQICDALIYLHGHEPVIVHRDIKPANIKLTASNDAMLVDFGIAKATGTGQKTTTGAVALTPGFAPPEQYGMGRADGRTDEYALGATMYTLLTNHTPPDSMERLLGNVTLTAPDQLRPELSPVVSAAIMRALELKPDDRFATVAEFKGALQGETLPEMHTISPSARETMVVGAHPTIAVGAHSTVLHTAGETVLAGPGSAGTIPVAPAAPGVPAVAKPKPAGMLLWLIPVGLLALVLVGGGVLAALLVPALFPAATATPTITNTLVVVASATPPPTSTPAPPTASATPAPPTAKPTLAATATATPVPATATATQVPTITPTAAPPIGGGGRIAFVSNRDGKFYQVYTMKPDGSDVQQLTFDERNKWGTTSPWTFHGSVLAWSPDGTQLLYVAPGAGTDSHLNVWIIGADGSNPQNLTAALPGYPTGDDYNPDWCKDGTIAFTTKRYNGVPQVATITLENRRPRNTSLLDRFGQNPNEWDPTLFPQNCKRMLNVTVQNGMPEIWRVYPDLKSWRLFLSDIGIGASAEEPAVSPNEKFVVYTRYSTKARDIIQTTVADSQFNMIIKQLTTTGNNYMPQWSPDGKWVTFVSTRDGNREVYVMTAAGTGQVDLSQNSADDVSPAWQPALTP